jgi:hypothetical protein
MRQRTVLAAVAALVVVGALASDQAPVGAKRGRTDEVRAAIKRAVRLGAVDSADGNHYLRSYRESLYALRRLSGQRRVELGSVLQTLRGIAHSKRLTADRLRPLFLILDRNREWWTSAAPPPPATRLHFGSSRVIFQYYPGHGLQIQPLANFGAANGYWQSHNDGALRSLIDDLVSLRVERGGFTAWEYYFHFGGGSPPWISGMAQATAMQALARAGRRLNDPALLEVAREARGAFELRTPVGARVPTRSGAWYALYSFAPQLNVLNGMLQSLIGLNTYAAYSGDRRAGELFSQGDAVVRARIQSYDTGAWSLYSRSFGRPGAEASLNYHILNRDFARRLCEATHAEQYCAAADDFDRYLHEGPTLEPFGPAPAPARAGRGLHFYFTLSKVGRVGITVKGEAGPSGGARTYLSTSAGFPRGRHYFAWVPARRRREHTYEYKLFARDLPGNTGSAEGTIRVKGIPRPRARGH